MLSVISEVAIATSMGVAVLMQEVGWPTIRWRRAPQMSCLLETVQCSGMVIH